jgi:hypothetical protein
MMISTLVNPEVDLWVERREPREEVLEDFLLPDLDGGILTVVRVACWQALGFGGDEEQSHGNEPTTVKNTINGTKANSNERLDEGRRGRSRLQLAAAERFYREARPLHSPGLDSFAGEQKRRSDALLSINNYRPNHGGRR